MFIGIVTGGKYKYVKLLEGYRDENGKTRNRVVKTFGRLDVLLKEDPEAVNKLKAKYNGQHKEKFELQQKQRLKDLEETLAFQVDQSRVQSPLPLLNYGHFAVKQIWEEDLALDRKFKYVQQTSKLKFDLNSLVRYLVAGKILEPGSIEKTFRRKDEYLGDPIKDITLDNCYDAYTYLFDLKEEIIKWVNRRMNQSFGTGRTRLLFYDVTNTYFETTMSDKEKDYERSDFAEVLIDTVKQAVISEELPVDCLDREGNVIVENLPAAFIEKLTDDKYRYFRMRGPSKEHRFDLPLVSIALVIDQNGIPLDFQVYAGNASEFAKMPESIRKLKEKYDVEEAVVVADRGLNSVENLTMLNGNNLGFLMAQKVTKLGETLTKKMLDRSRYQPLNSEVPDDNLYQVVSDWEKSGGNGSKINCTLVFTFNKKRQKRDQAILKLWQGIVLAKKQAGVKIGPRKTGWACLAKTENGKDQPILGIDEKVLQNKLALCGYAAVVYKESPIQADKDGVVSERKNPILKDAEIAGMYHRLNCIEDCFRVMKSNLGLRPMYVFNSKHIIAHCLLVYLALITVRLIQNRAEKSSVHVTAEEISTCLREANVAPLLLSEERSVFATVEQCSNLRKGLERQSTSELVEMIKSGKIKTSKTPEILEACGLKMPNRFCSLHELARSLKTKFPDFNSAVPTLKRLDLL